MYRGQKAQDHENFEADTPMADNRRADYRRRARVDRTRDFYRGRAHFWCASLRTGHLPDENIILEGHAFGVVLLEPCFRGVLVGEDLARDAP